jgi:hypothetical protein
VGRSRDDFDNALAARFREAAASRGADYLDVNAGDLHREVGGYPGRDHRMPLCCAVMRAALRDGDVVLSEPPRGAGSSLLIRYRLPRR